MKKYFPALFFFISTALHAQDKNLLLQQAANFEKQLNDAAALDKYNAVLTVDTTNIVALVKCAEINCTTAEQQPDKNARKNYFLTAQIYARRAFAADSASSLANYIMAYTALKLTTADIDNKTLVQYIKDVKKYIDKSLQYDLFFAKANYVCGMWHYEMLHSSWIKKAPVKSFYKSLPEAEIDSAINYMEKCKALDPYYVQNYLDLAKAYQYNNEPAKAITILTAMVRLPNRTSADAALKQKGTDLLATLQ